MQDMSDPTVPNLPNTTVAEWEQIADTLQNHVDSLPGIVAVVIGSRGYGRGCPTHS